MDTKWKKWKGILSFLAFFMGVNLLIGSLCISGIVVQRTNGLHELSSVLSGDYQATEEFRNCMSNYLENFLAMAAGKEIHRYERNETGVNAEGDMIFDGTDVTLSEERSESNWSGNWSEEWDPEDWYGEAGGMPQTWLHEQLKDDKNVLYSVEYDGKVKYTNATGTALATAPGSAPKLPEGYNFLMYFDGKTVHIEKDGKEIDPYGDGYYDSDSPWYIPGYKNFTVSDSVARAKIKIAVIQSPKMFINSSDYRDGDESNRLYWMVESMKETRTQLIFAGVQFCLAAGPLALAVLWRKERAPIRKKIGKLTGKLWFELKLGIVLLALLTVYIHCIYRYFGFSYFIGEAFGELLYYTLGTLCESLELVIFVVWLLYLSVNDLKENPKPWEHSLFLQIRAVVQSEELRFPFQKRLIRKFGEIVLLVAVLLVMALLFLFACYQYDEYFLLLFSLLIILILLPSIYFYGRENKRMIEDVGLLINQIETIRNGDLKSPLSLPEDPDLRAAVENLNDIQHGMNAAFEEQTKSERMKVELIANVSHDIKTPLTSIVSYAEILKEEEELPEHVKDYINILDSKAQRLKTMVQDVFEVSKAASGELPVRMEVLDFGKLLFQTLADMSEQIEASTVTIRQEIPKNPVMIYADGQRLYRVFQNLLQNALKYSLDGSRVYVILTVENGLAAASVKNTSAVELPKDIDFTERFIRGDESRTDGGSGLGLSIASTFTDACGGSFAVECDADLFTAVVTFPVKK